MALEEYTPPRKPYHAEVMAMQHKAMHREKEREGSPEHTGSKSNSAGPAIRGPQVNVRLLVCEKVG